MRVLIIKTFPAEIQWRRPAYNVQELGLAAALRRRGVEADVMCIAEDGHAATHVVRMGRTDVPLHCAKAFRQVKNNAWFRGTGGLEDGYDVLMPEEYNELYTWHLAKTHPGRVVCYHGPYFHPFNRGYNRMAKGFDAFFLGRYKRLGTPFLTKSDLARAYLEGKGLTRVRTVGVGLDLSFFGGREAAPLPRGEGGGRLELLYLGVLTERRNALFLLDVAGELAARGVDFGLTVIGAFADEEYKRRFWSRVEERNLGGAVRHVPRVEQKDLADVYGATDVFLLPTRYDIFGMVLLEAMHFGRAVLTTRNGGSETLIEDGKNGFILDGGDAGAWAGRIEALGRDRGTLAAVGAAAKETVDAGYTWDALAGRFCRAFEDCLAGRWT